MSIIGDGRFNEYQAWRRARRRGQLCREWAESFLVFRDGIGRKPFRARLCPKDPTKPIGPGNFKWEKGPWGRYPLTRVNGVPLRNILREAGINTVGRMDWARDLYLRRGMTVSEIVAQMKRPRGWHRKK